MTWPGRGRTRDDFSEEVQAHLDLETDRLIAKGRSAEEARAEARRAFGNVTLVEERFYETSRWALVEQLWQDIRYGCRGLRRSPSFAATTVLTLAVGIAMLTVAFAVFDAYVLRPFAVRDPHGLHQIAWHARESGGQSFTWLDYAALVERTDVFSAVVGEHTRFVSSGGRPLMAAFVSPNYFEALGPRIEAGRGLAARDSGAGPSAAVLSDQAWSRLYARDPQAVGRPIEINGESYTIVGILDPRFVGLGDLPRDVFLPRDAAPSSEARVAQFGGRAVEVLVRLQGDMTAARAAAAITPMLQDRLAAREAFAADVRPQPSPNVLSIQMLAVLSPVFAAFGLVLLTACANVSNVMLARAVARRREIAVRLSIGASRPRIVRQLLTEGCLLAALAGGAALVLGWWGLQAAIAVVFRTLPASVAPLLRVAPLTFDLRVYTFALFVCAITVVAFALLPALQAARAPVVGVRDQSGSRRGSRGRNALVAAQVAVALVLVVLAATLARNGIAVTALDLGFSTGGVTSINVRDDNNAVVRPLADALVADPRVSSVAVTSGNPLFNVRRTLAVSTGANVSTVAQATFVSPQFFTLLHLPILRGRPFRDDEAYAGARVAIVSGALASTLWPGEDPVGRVLRIERADGRPIDELPDYPEVTIVGTTRDIVNGIIVAGRDAGRVYLPTAPSSPYATALLVSGRTVRDPDSETLDAIFRKVTSDPQTLEAVPLSEMRDLQLYPLRAAAWVGSLLGIIALVMSVSGLYGVLTYTLSQRRKELGIRLALGATAPSIVALVLGQSARLAGIGAIAGGVVAYCALALLGSVVRLAAISVLDPGAFGAAGVVIGAATLLAAWQPARRAAQVDPVEALRADT